MSKIQTEVIKKVMDVTGRKCDMCGKTENAGIYLPKGWHNFIAIEYDHEGNYSQTKDVCSTDCYGSLISFMIDGYKWDEIDGMTPEFAKDLSDRLAIKIQYTSTDCQKAE